MLAIGVWLLATHYVPIMLHKIALFSFPYLIKTHNSESRGQEEAAVRNE